MSDQRIRRGKIRVDLKGDWRKIVPIVGDDYEPLGIVQQGTSTAGVLARHKGTGSYVQVNAVETKTLDQRKVKVALEAGAPVGRPATSYEIMQPVMVRMGPTLKAFFEKMGDGEVSAGVRNVGEEARQRFELEERKRANNLADIQTGK